MGYLPDSPKACIDKNPSNFYGNVLTFFISDLLKNFLENFFIQFILEKYVLFYYYGNVLTFFII